MIVQRAVCVTEASQPHASIGWWWSVSWCWQALRAAPIGDCGLLVLCLWCKALCVCSARHCVSVVQGTVCLCCKALCVCGARHCVSVGCWYMQREKVQDKRHRLYGRGDVVALSRRDEMWQAVRGCGRVKWCGRVQWCVRAERDITDTCVCVCVCVCVCGWCSGRYAQARRCGPHTTLHCAATHSKASPSNDTARWQVV